MSAEDDLPPLKDPDRSLVEAARAGIDALRRRNGRITNPEGEDDVQQPKEVP